MTTNQDTRGFLPPTTTNPLSSTTTGNHPHHLSGYTALRLPPKTPPTATTTVTGTEEESQLVSALAHAIIKFRDAVTTTTRNTQKNQTKSDVNSSVTDQEHVTTTVKRNPIHLMLLQSDNHTHSTDGHQERQKTTTTPPFPGARTEYLDLEDNPQVKRLRMEELMTESELDRCNSGITEDHEEEHDHDAVADDYDHDDDDDDEDDDDDHNPSQAIVEQDTVRSEERVQFKQHDDGGVSIRLTCSCGKSYEMLLTDQDDCFYRLI